MLKIYGADLSTPANKVRMVANALNLEYEYIRISIREGEHRKEKYLKINPIGKVPAIDDDGFLLFESNAISKYLASRHKSSLYPTDLNQRAIIDAWMDFTSIHIGTALNRVTFNRLFAPIINVEPDKRSLQDGLDFLSRFLPVADTQLANNKYITGNEFSLADICLLATLDPCEVSQVDLSQYRNITKWRNELKQQEFYTKCHKDFSEVLKQMMATMQGAKS